MATFMAFGAIQRSEVRVWIDPKVRGQVQADGSAAAGYSVGGGLAKRELT